MPGLKALQLRVQDVLSQVLNFTLDSYQPLNVSDSADNHQDENPQPILRKFHLKVSPALRSQCLLHAWLHLTEKGFQGRPLDQQQRHRPFTGYFGSKLNAKSTGQIDHTVITCLLVRHLLILLKKVSYWVHWYINLIVTGYESVWFRKMIWAGFNRQGLERWRFREKELGIGEVPTDTDSQHALTVTYTYHMILISTLSYQPLSILFLLSYLVSLLLPLQLQLL